MRNIKQSLLLENAGFEENALNTILKNKQLYAPLKIIKIKRSIKTNNLEIILVWKNKKILLTAEAKYRSAPSIIQGSIFRLKKLDPKQNPLLIVPNLSKSTIDMIQDEKISGIDLNGNYIIQTQELLAVRLDRKNQYKENQSIKKIFSGNSSLIGRMLLSNPQSFSTVSEIYQELRRRIGVPNLSTVSKVLKGLEEQLIIEKIKGKIRLLQANKLLDLLRSEYVSPKTQTTVRLKLPGQGIDFFQSLSEKLRKTMWCISGESSAERYTVTTKPSQYKIYALQTMGFEEYQDERFGNVLLLETAEPYLYFDRKMEADGIVWSSMLQSYLELSRLDKREREISESIRKDILKNFK